jgi:hypothetical protein
VGIRWYIGICVVVGLGLALVVQNVITLRRLWASPIFERSQKIAQTILIWLVPGSVIVVRATVDPPRDNDTDDPTIPRSIENPYQHGG